MYEDARKYLAKVVYWPDYAGNEYVNIHNSFQNDKYDKPGWAGRACHTIGDAINYIDWSLKTDGTLGIYACMSTQATCEETTNRAGGITRKAKRSAETAIHLKSLFLDCDFKGGEHGYEDEKSALAALAGFLQASGLPKPNVVVHSGGGFHVYWTLDRALTVGAWRPLAYALAEATKRHNFKCDTQCTVDAARILRVPDTLNRKQDPARPVRLVLALEHDYSVERLESVLKSYEVAVPRLVHAEANLDPILFPPKPPVENDLGAGIGKEETPFHLDDVAKECAFVKEAVSTGGATYSQPLWNLTSLIATFTDDPVADMHRMSDKHPTYTKEASDEMLARKQRERETKGLGWPSCASISAAGCVACQSCPHFGKGKTPLHFAVGTAVLGSGGGSTSSATAPNGVTPQVTALPSGYFLNNRGLVSKIVDDEQSITIADYSIEDPQLHSNSPEQFSFLSGIERGKKRRVYIDLKSIGAMDMRSILHGQGFLLQSGAKHVNLVSDFMTSWIKLLRETRDSVQAAPFGWAHTEGDTPDGFAYDSTLWTPAGPKAVSCSDPVAAKRYKPIGKMEAWQEAAKLITDQKRPALEVIVSIAFAAPLMKLTGWPGVVISAYGPGGTGKTTSGEVSTAVWGHPVNCQFRLVGTENSIGHTMTTMQSLPIYWDEIQRQQEMDAFVGHVFSATSGTGKNRLTKNITLRDPGSFQTILTVLSNYSLIDNLTHKAKADQASLYRVFEFKVPDRTNELGVLASSTAQDIIDRLKHNFGGPGLEYAKWLGANYPKAKADMKQLLLEIEQKYSTEQPERFWLAGMASLILGARYSVEFGFWNPDLPAIEKFLGDELLRMRADLKERPVLTRSDSVVELIQQFCNSIRAKHMLFTNNVHLNRGAPTKDYIKVATSHCQPEKLEGIRVQFGIEDRVLRISHTHLSNYLRANDIQPRKVIDQLKTLFGADVSNGRLGAGLPRFTGLAEQVITIHAKDTELDFEA